MLKLLSSKTDEFHNFKCGEIYCGTPTNYIVGCCLCATRLPYDEFPQHFQNQHPLDNQLEIVKSTITILDSDNEETPVPTSGNNKTSLNNDSSGVEHPAAIGAEIEDEKPIDLLDVLQAAELDKDGDKIIVLEHCAIENADSDDDWTNDDSSMQKDRDDNDNDDEWHLDIVHEKDEDEASEKVDDDDEEDEDASNEVDTVNEIRYPCDLCSLSYKTKRYLGDHKRKKHRNGQKIREIECKNKECGAVFRSELRLIGHRCNQPGIFCDFCGRSFSQLVGFKSHRVRHTGVKAFKCKECDNDFYTKPELKAHMMRHTGILPVVCEICGRRCRDHGVYTAHMRRHTGERPAKCEVCGKCFYSGYDLNVHSVTHSNERPFSCDVCGSTFQTKKALRVHKKLHSSERKHECKVCGKSFLQSTSLNSHMKSHEIT